MNVIYTATGTVNAGFIGQIAYSVCLEKTYKKLEVQLAFDKQRPKKITQSLIELVKKTVLQKYNKTIALDEAKDIARQMKTEIQLVVNMNDEFIGGIHRQMKTRSLIISEHDATAGGIRQQKIEGVIKVVVIFFNVLYDKTPYTLSLLAE